MFYLSNLVSVKRFCLKKVCFVLNFFVFVLENSCAKGIQIYEGGKKKTTEWPEKQCCE